MNAILNITHAGVSRDLPERLPFGVPDEDIKRISAEALDVAPTTFQNFVVDRFDTPEGGKRLFLRPKVPFGA